MSQTIDSGDIVIKGDSILTNYKQAVKKIGICMQNDSGLFEELTVKEHIDLYRQIAFKKSDLDVVKYFGLDEHLNKKAG